MALIAQDPILDYCLGAMYGAMFGDALGSYCEFQKNVSSSTMLKAM